MTRWSRRRTSRSKRKRLNRGRLLRFDVLESRRLLCSSPFGCSLERWDPDDGFDDEKFDEDDFEYGESEHDRFEIEDHDDAEEWFEASSAIVFAMFGGADSDSGEPEDDGEDFVAADLQVEQPAAPTSTAASEELRLGDLLVHPSESSRTDDATDDRDDDEVRQSEPSSAKVSVEEDREDSESSDGAGSDGAGSDGAVSQSLRQEASADVDTEFEQQDRIRAETPEDPADRVAPDAASNADQRDDLAFNGNVPLEESSAEPDRSTSRLANEDGEPPSLAIKDTEQGPQRAFQSVTPGEWRNIGTERGEPAATHDAMGAAVESALTANNAWRLFDALTPDLSTLETALLHLLHRDDETADGADAWFLTSPVVRWALAATIGLLAAETIRRRVKHAHSSREVPAYSQEDVSLRHFPELLGLPPDAAR